jgi:hypothetical protein
LKLQRQCGSLGKCKGLSVIFEGREGMQAAQSIRQNSVYCRWQVDDMALRYYVRASSVFSNAYSVDMFLNI